jgi:DNA polymerase-3 subunit gamma/tau
LRDAQTLFDQVIAFCGSQVQDEEVALLLGMAGEEQLLLLMAAILAHEPPAVLDHLSHLFQYGHDARELCRQLLEYLRGMIVVKVAPQGVAAIDRTAAEIEVLQKLGGQASLEELHTLFDLLSATEAKVRDSAQPIWLLEVSLIKLASLPPLQPLERLVVRLETLEHSFGPTTVRPPPHPLPNAPSATEVIDAGGARLDTPPVVAEAEPPFTGAAPSLTSEPAQVSSPDEAVRKIIESASTRALGWILEQHCAMHLTESALEIHFHGNNRMARELLQEGETQRTLQQMAKTVVGRALTVRIIDTPEADAPGQLAIAATLPTNDNRLPLPQAQVVRDTLELFGGRIVDIRERSVNREVTVQPISGDEMVNEEDNDDE